ncbi:MAG TPA: hypothetical protein VNW92_04100 [Polyangiaceae bacterium]|nr:hypothetical protein [Polyangiaceae bacterium]
MSETKRVMPIWFAALCALLCAASVGCIRSEPPVNDASTLPPPSPTADKGAPDAVNATPGSGNTRSNGSPGPEGGPGSLGAGIGSGSGTGTGAGPGNSGSVSGSVSK